MKQWVDYQELVDQALRDVVRLVLKDVQENGLSGNHQLYISFQTRHPNVIIAGFLREKHPQEITIVLQHEFWNLEVTDRDFAITLSFNGKPENITAPFSALTGFADPSVQFGLQFQKNETNTAEGLNKNNLPTKTNDPNRDESIKQQALKIKDSNNTFKPNRIPDETTDDTDNIIALNKFREK